MCRPRCVLFTEEGVTAEQEAGVLSKESVWVLFAKEWLKGSLEAERKGHARYITCGRVWVCRHCVR